MVQRFVLVVEDRPRGLYHHGHALSVDGVLHGPDLGVDLAPDADRGLGAVGEVEREPEQGTDIRPEPRSIGFR